METELDWAECKKLKSQSIIVIIIRDFGREMMEESIDPLHNKPNAIESFFGMIPTLLNEGGNEARHLVGQLGTAVENTIQTVKQTQFPDIINNEKVKQISMDLEQFSNKIKDNLTTLIQIPSKEEDAPRVNFSEVDEGIELEQFNQLDCLEAVIPKFNFEAKIVSENACSEATELLPGVPFSKTWKIINTGDEWPHGCVLKFVGGSKFSSEGEINLPALKPQETAIIVLEMVAPSSPGIHSCFYRVCYPCFDGDIVFGDSVWCSVNIIGEGRNPCSTQNPGASSILTEMGFAVTAVHQILGECNGDVNKALEELLNRK